jgi:hypothetical protein
MPCICCYCGSFWFLSAGVADAQALIDLVGAAYHADCEAFNYRFEKPSKDKGSFKSLLGSFKKKPKKEAAASAASKPLSSAGQAEPVPSAPRADGRTKRPREEGGDQAAEEGPEGDVGGAEVQRVPKKGRSGNTAAESVDEKNGE